MAEVGPADPVCDTLQCRERGDPLRMSSPATVHHRPRSFNVGRGGTLSVYSRPQSMAAHSPSFNVGRGGTLSVSVKPLRTKTAIFTLQCRERGDPLRICRNADVEGFAISLQCRERGDPLRMITTGVESPPVV